MRFEGLTAVDTVDETLRPGEILGLIGPNGAGKTTLVNAMTGFQMPADGQVILGDKVASGLPPHWFRR
ncbi:MAG: ATP-binding cassette domain-containing protein, partial [Verrucomicrobiia bacterium]